MTDKLEEIEFTVKCKMRLRWAEQFIGMLKLMEALGREGSSREIIFLADGDGDFRPQFECDADVPAFDPKVLSAEPKLLPQEKYFFEAG